LNNLMIFLAPMESTNLLNNIFELLLDDDN